MGHHQNRRSRHGAWWIPDEAPGGVGARELWIDESALDSYGRGDAAPAVTVVPPPGWPGNSSWAGAVIRFSTYPGLDGPAVYRIGSRRYSQANLGRPYYVGTWPD